MCAKNEGWKCPTCPTTGTSRTLAQKRASFRMHLRGHNIEGDEAERLVNQHLPNVWNGCKTYTDRLKRNYDKAKCLNNEEKDFYHCAKPNKPPTKRNLNWEGNSPFLDQEKKPNKDINEYRVEAFLVDKAKKKDWNLPIIGEDGKEKNWELLDAERNFAGYKGRLDLLAYSEDEKAYIVLELKVADAATTAVEELVRYIKNLKKEIACVNRVYEKQDGSAKIKGYLVCPKSDNITNMFCPDGKFGIICFPNFADKNDLIKKMQNGEMKFEVIRETNS